MHFEFYPSVYSDRGFLCHPDPLTALPSSYEYNAVDRLSHKLPGLVQSGNIREHLSQLPLFDLPYDRLSLFKNRPILNRLRMLYAYFASAFVHGEGTIVDYIPASIAKPLCIFSEIVKRPPILSYVDYALNNWCRIDANKDIELGNIRLLQGFHGVQDEDWFILVHVDIEAKAGNLLCSMYRLTEFIESQKPYNDDFFAHNMEVFLTVFKSINLTMDRMPEKCSPDVYYKKVRPYIFGFNNIVYNGVDSCSFFGDSKYQSFRGETGAQSTLIPCIISALGVRHKSSMLTKHLDDMRRYMPVSHRNFVAHLEQTKSIRDFIIDKKLGSYIKNIYNQILDELCLFREKHFQYAVNYIQNKCESPDGTGGTPYIQWLNDLIKETKTYYFV